MKIEKHRCVVTCSHGFEPFLQRELRRINIQNVKTGTGSVQFHDTLSSAYKAMLWSRIGSRVLLEIGRFEGTTQDELYDGMLEIRWEDHMDVDGTLWIDFTGFSKEIRHTQFAARKAKDAIADRFRDRFGRRPSVDKDADLRIHIHLHHGLFVVSIDLCGTPLHQRTPDKHITDAPLKETLAATLLYASGWDKMLKRGFGLLDPMCGSGTIALEAMGLACNRAPGLLRENWNLFQWKQFDAAGWNEIVEMARSQELTEAPCDVFAFDIDAAAIACVKHNAKKQGIPVPTARVQPLRSLTPPSETGFIVSNPPYGERIGSHAHVATPYLDLGQTLSRFQANDFDNAWRCFLLCPPNELYQQTGYNRTEERITLYNGPLKCRFLELDLNKPIETTSPSVEGSTEE